MSTDINQTIAKLNDTVQKLSYTTMNLTDSFNGVPNEIRGVFVKGYCPHCAAEIHLHSKMASGFCPLCGGSVQRKAAEDREFDRALVDFLTGDEYYKLAGKDIEGKIIPAHAETAAKKGCTLAALELGAFYTGDENHKAIHYYQMAVDLGSADGVVGLETLRASEGYLVTASDLDESIRNVEQAMKKGLAHLDRSYAKQCISALRQMKKDLEQKARVREQRELDVRAWAAQKRSEGWTYESNGHGGYNFVPPGSSSSPDSSGTGAYGYPDSLGPSYHPDINISDM